MLPPTKKKKFNPEFIAIPKEKAEKIIISKNVTTEETLLEKVDHLTLPDKFVSKYSNIYAVDMGSSFVKGKQLSIFDGNVESSLIKFVDNSLEFLPTKFFRNIDNGRVSVSIPRTCNGASNTWLPLENIKKIFMIYQLLEISIGSHQVRVATIMKDIVKCVFEEMTHTVTDDCPDFEGLDCLIFTCPTGTSKTSKLIFRNTIHSALKDYIPHSKVELEDVFVFEESNCLHWHTVQRKGVKMLIDIGHLTIDIIVMMNDKIIYKNSEAVGSASLHSI